MIKDLRELLKIEEDGELLEYRITEYNLPLWLFIRSDLIHFYLPQKIFGIENPHVHVDPFKLPLRKKLDYILKTLIKNPFRAQQKDILIFGAGINNSLRDGYYYNRLYDPFWSRLGEQIQVLESSYKFYYPTPRFNNEILYSDIIPIASGILGKFTKISQKERDTVKEFAKKLRDKTYQLLNINIDEYLTKNEEKWIDLISKIKIRILIFKKLLNLIKPKLIIIEDAHYGGYTDLISIAKEFKIKVAEYQHGFVGVKHLAYNYSESIQDVVYKYLPDYLLLWGEYWSTKVTIPGEKVVIGFPYFEEEKEKAKKEKIVLLLSGGSIPEEIVNFGSSLITLSEFKDYKFIFRPHPSERSAVKERYKSLLDLNYELDLENLYDTLKKTEICIALELTTVLFEAIGFNCRTFLKKTTASSIFLEDSNLSFEVFDSMNDLVNKIIYNNHRSNYNLLFAENSLNNFEDFLKRCF